MIHLRRVSACTCTEAGSPWREIATVTTSSPPMSNLLRTGIFRCGLMILKIDVFSMITIKICYFFVREDLSVKFLGLERQHHLQVWLHTNDNAMLKARKVSWMNPKCGTQGFLLKFTPGFRQAWAKMLDVEGGFNPLVKVSFQLLLYFSDILCWSSPLLGYCARLLRLHIRAAYVWEGRRQQGVCLSVRILQLMEIHAFTPRKYGSRNTTR